MFHTQQFKNREEMKNSTQTTANKVTPHTAMAKGARLKNCKNKTFAEAQRLEQINYIRKFGMGDKRNWSANY